MNSMKDGISLCGLGAVDHKDNDILAPTYRNKFSDIFPSSINQGFIGNCFDKADLRTFFLSGF